MNRTIAAFAALALAVGTGAHAETGDAAKKGEAKLAKMLEGRTAGKPVGCISARMSNKLQVIDKTALVYDAGNTIYVARPSDPESLDTRDVLVINRYSSQLCKEDVIKTVDRMNGFLTGVVFLGDFVPYEKG